MVWVAANAADVAFAATSPTRAIAVQATVLSRCFISTTQAVNFGNYSPTGANSSTGVDRDATGTITVVCAPGSGLSISIDLGAHALVNQRRMQAGSGQFLNYQLYRNAGRTRVWGTGGQSRRITNAPNTNPRAYTVYGRIPRGQNVANGTYTDTVQVVVNF